MMDSAMWDSILKQLERQRLILAMANDTCDRIQIEFEKARDAAQLHALQEVSR